MLPLVTGPWHIGVKTLLVLLSHEGGPDFLLSFMARASLAVSPSASYDPRPHGPNLQPRRVAPKIPVGWQVLA